MKNKTFDISFLIIIILLSSAILEIKSGSMADSRQGLTSAELRPESCCHCSRFNKEFGMKEIWKDIEGFEKQYRVSNFGRIKRKRYKVKNGGGYYFLKERIKKPQMNWKGYLFIVIKIGETAKNLKVHRLVAQAFIENPYNKPTVNHKDNNKLNNHVSNLEWMTYYENMRHAIDNGYKNMKGELHPNSRLTEIDIRQIRELHLKKEKTYIEIAEIFKINKITVYKIVSRRAWKHI
jgi:hypothetical protein